MVHDRTWWGIVGHGRECQGIMVAWWGMTGNGGTWVGHGRE